MLVVALLASALAQPPPALRPSRGDAPCTLSIERVQRDARGRADTQTTRLLDARGSVLVEQEDFDRRIPRSGRGPRWRRTHHHDASGRRVLMELDRGVDGTIDERTRFHYDEDGHVVLEERDRGADGTVDVTTTHTWVAGLEVLREQTWYGALRERTRWTHDAAGHRTTEVHEEQLDFEPSAMARFGPPPGGQTTTWTRDAAGRALTVHERVLRRDARGGWTPHVRHTSNTWHADGRLLVHREHRGESDEIVRTHTRTHDAEGRVVRVATQTTGRAGLDRERVLTWDAAGRKRSQVEKAGGRPRQRTTWAYAPAACPAR